MERILFITNVYPNNDEPFRGIYIKNRAEQLNKNGYICRVAFLDEKNRTTLDDFSQTFFYKHKTSKLNYFGLGKKPLIDENFYKYIDSFNPSLIIFCITSLWLKIEILKKRKNFKYANFFEGRNADGLFSNTLVYNLFIKKREKQIFKKMDYLFFCSEIAKNDFIRKFPKINSDKCFVLLNGYNKEIFKPVKKHEFNKNEIKIIAVGNIETTKGQRLLSKALAQVSGLTNKKIILKIVGTGNANDVELIRTDLQNAGIFFEYEKQIEPVILAEKLREFDYFILPSYFESFGCVYLEAMSQGLITVGCQNQGPSLFIKNNQNGLLVKENDIKDLIACLTDIILGKIDIKKLSHNAIMDSQNFGWESFGIAFKKASFQLPR